MRSHGPAARPHALVDLYVPARLGSPDALQARARTAGLDAIVVVAEDAFELPNPEALAAVNTNGGPRVLVAPMITGPGFRFVLFLPAGEVNLESIESAGDARVVQAAVAELGGLALAASPRQGPGGEVSRAAPVLGTGRHGVVALVLPGSRLGRDLDLEDTAAAERPILGASGPFATLAEVGRYATLLPIDLKAVDLEMVAARVHGALERGLGLAVEIEARGPEPRPRPDPREGRNDEEGERRGGRRRRRRQKAA